MIEFRVAVNCRICGDHELHPDQLLIVEHTEGHYAKWRCPTCERVNRVHLTRQMLAELRSVDTPIVRRTLPPLPAPVLRDVDDACRLLRDLALIQDADTPADLFPEAF